MRANGVGSVRAKMMYWAVAVFGPRWRLTASSSAEREIVCHQIFRAECCPTGALTPEAVAEFSLDDENMSDLARAKILAVARTLKTSGGQILDITPFGNVNTSVESIAAHADRVRDLLSRETPMVTAVPNALPEWGLMYFSPESELPSFDDIPNWDEDEIPVFSEVPTLEDLDLIFPPQEETTFRM